MAGVREKPNPNNDKFQSWYYDSNGKRRFFWGTRNRTDTLHTTQRLEDEYRQVRLGYRPTPGAADKNISRLFGDAKDEYLAWGETQGGRSGKPWGKVHARNRRSHLAWWKDRLGLKAMSDLYGILYSVEAALRDLQAQGRAGNTIAN